MNWIRLAPVTAESIIVCVVIFASCLVPSKLSRERFADLQRECGAIQSLKSVESLDGIGRARELELQGPFDVWKGEWWRIPLTAIHHADLLHLVLSLGAAWYLGSRLERSWGSFAMCLFLWPASCIPVMAELAQGHAMIGFSGIDCAMLGVLVVLRRFDDRVANEFPAQAAEIGMSLIVVVWFASLLGIFSSPNTGHLAGFAFGAFIGLIEGIGRQRSWSVIFRRATMLLMSLSLIPAMVLVCHPIWLARYHWHQAIASNHTFQTERSLRRAIRCDPSLTAVWLFWSRLAEASGDQSEAWERLIQGLALNPSSSPLIEGTQRLWRHLNVYQRRDAELAMQVVFGRAADAWLEQIRAGALVRELNSNEEVSNIEEKIDPSQYPLDQKIELHLTDPAPAQPKFDAPTVPVPENDAMEGKSV